VGADMERIESHARRASDQPTLAAEG